MKRLRVSIYHKSMWPRYKGAIFSEVYRRSQNGQLDVSFIHVADTDEIRKALGGVDLSYHKYPFRLMVRGSYEDVSTAKRLVALIKDLLTHPADLVVLPGYDRIENWAMLFMCMVLGRKRAVFCDSTIHDNPQVSWKSKAKRFFFSRCDGFIGYGQRSKEYLVSLGADPATVIIPCVAAALPHEYDAEIALARYSQAPATPGPSFLYVGRLSREKGLFDLLEAFHRVHQQIPSARLDLVGEGNLREALTQRIGEFALAGSVTLHGTLTLADIQPLFVRSTAMVLPSHTEPWGLVVNEAMSYGCPVVVSDKCGCVPELVIDGVTGYCFATGNVEALTTALLAVTRLPGDRQAIAAQCIRTVAKLSPEQAGARMYEGCAELLDARS